MNTEKYNVVCFDIGIKNLAYCHLATEGGGANTYKVLGWENVNLTIQQEPQQELQQIQQQTQEPPLQQKKTTKVTCYACKGKVSYEGGSCGRHTPKPPLVDLQGNKIIKLPPLTSLKEILTKKSPGFKKSSSKTEILDLLRKHYTLPCAPPKVQKAAGMDMTLLHDRIRDMVLRCAPLWKTAKEICVENQPMLRPQMKSVQMLLFATIRDLFAAENKIPVRLVHAGGKVKGAAAGAEGYADRKKGGMERVADAIKMGVLVDSGQYVDRYNSATKKDDLADAFCMCIDAVKKQS